MEKQSEQELQAGTDAPTPDKKSTLAQVSQSSTKSPSSLDAFELDFYLRDRAIHHASEIAKDIPYLREMRDLLSAQGQRTDLKNANSLRTSRQPDSVTPSPDFGGTQRAIGRGRTNPPNKGTALRARGFMPTYIAKRAITATQPTGRRRILPRALGIPAGQVP